MNDRDHWLVRPTTVRRLWWVFAAVLALSVLVQLAIEYKVSLAVEGLPGFAAGFGFLACLAMVLTAKGLGLVLKRDETYYDRDDDDA